MRANDLHSVSSLRAFEAASLFYMSVVVSTRPVKNGAGKYEKRPLRRRKLLSNASSTSRR